MTKQLAEMDKELLAQTSKNIKAIVKSTKKKVRKELFDEAEPVNAYMETVQKNEKETKIESIAWVSGRNHHDRNEEDQA